MSAGLVLRDAVADDLPALRALRGRALALPTAAGERLLLAERAGAPRALLRLRPGIGLEQPRYWYHVGAVVHAAPELKLFRRQATLLLGNDLTGCAELGDLAVAAGEGDALAALLREALRIAAGEPQRYGATLIAELPGLRDAQGRAPFWDGLGRHFYTGDPPTAAGRHGDAWRSHVAALLPRQPVYTAFLPEPAQAAVGCAHADAQPLRDALEACGWRWCQHVAIDDGGPVLERQAGG